MLRLTAILVLGLIFLISSFSPLDVHDYKVKTIVIDAGHGGKDPGCSSFNAKEKDIALDIALKVGNLIKDNLPDVKIIYTRKDDHFVELHDRASFANKNNADLFISIHVNSGPAGMKGTETYCMGLHKTEQNLQVAQRENSAINYENHQDREKNYNGFDPSSPESYILFSLYQSAYLNNSMNLAGKIEREFKNSASRHSRGVKQAGFLVLWKTSMPSVLVETGFLSDSTDALHLKDEAERFKTAWAIYTAVEEYKFDLEAAEGE